MCGRHYSTYSDEELYFYYLNRRGWRWPVQNEIPAFKPNYNTCPTQTSLVLNVSDDTLGFRSMRWGLVPSWAKSVKDADKYSMINAKSEEIEEKRSYKSAFKSRRCIVPISGFFEWRRQEKTKQPFAIHIKDSPIMSLAGIWERWADRGTGEVVDSYCILTTGSDEKMSTIHDRMPIVLTLDQEAMWLDPAVSNPLELDQIINARNEIKWEFHPVSTLVNSPKNNSPEVLAAI